MKAGGNRKYLKPVNEDGSEIEGSEWVEYFKDANERYYKRNESSVSNNLVFNFWYYNRDVYWN